MFLWFRKGFALLAKDNKKGSVLFLVLLITLALLTLGGFFLSDSLDELLIAKHYEYETKAHYLAEAGAEVGLALIQAQPDYFIQRCSSPHCTFEPIYMSSKEEEQQYFVLEWIAPDPSPKDPSTFEGDPQYYTLYSTGYYYCSNGKGVAGVKAFFEVNGGENGIEAYFKSWSGW
ncbi:MAG: hypothetical protein ACOX6X_01015 [Dethiobacteria bacterium]